MGTEAKLESYLSALDKALEQISVSERAEIITEIKSHILDAQEKNPDHSLDSILESLGAPETVANRYILERGLKLAKPQRGSALKWVTIGLLGTFSIFAFLLLVLLWKFTPIISVDDDKVVILGGLIHVSGSSLKDEDDSSGLKISTHFHTNDGSAQNWEGSKKLDKSVEKVEIPFKHGNFQVSSGAGTHDLSWQCRGALGSPGALGESSDSYSEF